MASTAGPSVIKDSLYNYHICTSSGTFTPNFSGNVEVMVVAGGGGGGQDMGGGGGGGGYLANSAYAVTAGSGITVTVGAGGSGARARDAASERGSNGSNTVFGSLTAIGGGGGASYHDQSGYPAGNGGSGGGASGGGTLPSGGSGGGGYGGGIRGTGTSGQGNDGASGIYAWYPGGGGGAGAAGSTQPAHGGAGILNTILGKAYYWAGGGGGSGYSDIGGNGGIGGGGGGCVGYTTGGAGLNPGQPGSGGYSGTQCNNPGGAGGANTGGGGGGGSHYNYHNPGGNGGSGIVVIRYLKTLGTSTYGSGTVANKSSLVFSFDAGNPKKRSSVEVMVVAGGGGGGNDMGGGGGAGGLIYDQAYPISIGTVISITIGGGGAGATGYASNPAAGVNGTDTVFGTIRAIGGGGGGSGHYFPPPYAGQQGQSGGSGGGLSPLWGRNGVDKGGTGILGQGHHGGAAQRGDGAYKAGGGGGASQPGGSGGNTYAGNGGQGFLTSIDGTSRYWAGGGGGGHHEAVGGNGGAGGGGGGSGWTGGTSGTGGAGLNAGGNGILAAASSVGGAGGANTGGGGGGGGHQSTGGAGGSGIVIVRYSGSARATGGTITTSGGYTMHVFTSSGTFTPTDFLDPKDQSEYGNKITLVGPTYSSLNGGSLVFNGSTQYIDLGGDRVFASSGPWTIETWAYWDGVSSGNLYNFIGASSITQNSWYWTVYQSKLAIWNISPGGWYYGSTTIVPGKWYHCVITAASNNTTYQMYLDGVAEGGSHVGYAFNASYSGLTVGYLGMGNSSNGRYHYGKYSSVKLYNRALSASEVKQNFNALCSRFQVVGWMKPTTVFASGRLSDNLQIWTAQSSPAQYYSSVILNKVLTGDFTVIASWAHTYIGCGMVYKNGASLSDFTGYSADGNGPYFGALNTCGIASGTGYTYFGQYHAPIAGSGGSKPLYYFKWQRSGNTLTLQYSTTSGAGPWTNFSSSTSTTCSSTDQVIIGCGEADTSEDYPLTLVYVDTR